MTRAKLAVIDEYGILDPDAKISEASLPSWLSEAGFEATMDQKAAEVLLSTELIDTAERYAAGETATSVHIKAALDASVASKYIVRLRPATYVGNLTIPSGTTLVGAGIGKTIIQGKITIGSNVHIEGLTVESTTWSGFSGNADNSTLVRVQFKGGNASANLYVNDNKVTNIKFIECQFTDNVSGGNGIQLVDKGTAANHLENIEFYRCLFRNNNRMNFEVIQRSNAGNPVVLGYRNISHYGCRFEPPALTGNTVNINVSYDSGLLDGSTTQRSSGYSTVSNCEIIGGGYGLELAGAVHMTIENNIIRDSTGFLLSMSQVGANPANCSFTNNRFVGTVPAAKVTFMGLHNLIVGNYTRTPGEVRFASCGESQITGNYFDGLGFTTLSIETGFRLTFMANTILKGTNQTVLNIYAGSVNNAFIGNFLHVVNAGFDTRDGTVLNLSNNFIKRGSNDPIMGNQFEVRTSLPTASTIYRGKTYMIEGATGAADVLYLCVKKADDTYAWTRVPNSLDTTLSSANGTVYKLTVGDDGALTTTAL